MTYQTVNQIKLANQAYKAKTASYDTNGNYIRRSTWQGMNWIARSKRLSIYLRDRLQCQYCGKTILDEIRLTLDHVIPVAKYKGSKTDAKNIVTCCTNCNFRKQDLSLSAFAAILAPELNTTSDRIIKNIKNALNRKPKTSEAFQIVKAQKNWTNVFNHLKTK